MTNYYDACQECDRRGSEACHTPSCKDYAVAKIMDARDKARVRVNKGKDGSYYRYAKQKNSERLHRKKMSGN